MPYRTPGNDEELDERLDDELAQLSESAAPRPSDWRERRRSPYRLVFAAASVGGGIAMLSGQSFVGIACATLSVALVGASLPFLLRLGKRKVDHEHDDEERDDDEAA